MGEIPLFTRSVGVQVRPTDLPVEALSPWRSFQEGVQLADKLPSTPLAIARGIEKGIDLYNKNMAATQLQENSAIMNETASFDLARRRELAPIQLEDAKQMAEARGISIEAAKLMLKRQQAMDPLDIKTAEQRLSRQQSMDPLDIEAAKQIAQARGISIQAAELEVQKQKEMNPLLQQEAQTRLNVQKDKYAEQIRLTQQQQKLNSILAGNNQVAKVDALMGGEFTELFAKKQGLEDATARQLLPQLPPALREEYSKRKTVDAQAEWDRRRAEQQLDTYTQKLGELSGNQAVKDYRAMFQGATEMEAARDIEIKPLGSLEVDETGHVVTDPSTRNWKLATKPTTELNADKYSIAFSRKTGKVVSPKLDNKERDGLRSIIQAAEGAYRVSGSNGLYNEADNLTNRGKFMVTVHETLGDQQPQQQTQQPTSKPSIAETVTENAAAKANQPPPVAEGVTTIPLDKMPAYLDKLPLTDDKGAVQLSNDLTQIVVARTLGIPIEAAKQQKTEIEALLNAHSLDTPDITKMASADALIKSALRSEFRTNPEIAKKYTQEATDRYNASTQGARKYNWDQPPAAIATPALLERANNPEDYYVLDNYSRMATRLDSMLDSINRSAIKQQQAIAMKGLQGPRARQVLEAARSTK